MVLGFEHVVIIAVGFILFRMNKVQSGVENLVALSKYEDHKRQLYEARERNERDR